MATAPNFTKQLVDALKAQGVKVTKHDAPNGKASRLKLDGRSLARVFPRSDALSVYVFAEKLPAKLAKHFRETQGEGYSIKVKSDDELRLAVEALVLVAGETTDDDEQPAAKSEPASSSKQATTASKRASARKRGPAKLAAVVDPVQPEESAS